MPLSSSLRKYEIFVILTIPRETHVTKVTEAHKIKNIDQGLLLCHITDSFLIRFGSGDELLRRGKFGKDFMWVLD